MKTTLAAFLILVVCSALTYASAPIARCQVCWIRENAGEEPVVDSVEFESRVYYFCSNECVQEFLEDPDIWSMDPVPGGNESASVTSFPS